MTPLKDSLHFTRSERVGFLLLALILITLLVLPSQWNKLFPPDQQEFQRLEAALLLLEEGQLKNKDQKYQLHTFDPNTVTADELIAMGLSEKLAKSWINYRKKVGLFDSAEEVNKLYLLPDSLFETIKPYLIWPEKRQPNKRRQTNSQQLSPEELFYFDPNTVTKSDLMKLGLSAKQSQTLINYRNKGGRFRSAEDLEKLYGFSKSWLLRTKPYVQVIQQPSEEIVSNDNTSEVQSTPDEYVSTIPSKRFVRIDINQASIEEWQKLRGIGPYYAGRIVKFREALGGFISVEQVGDTYGLPDSTFQQIQTSLDASPVRRKLPINTITMKELAAHPYLSFKEAKAIVYYRKNHGTFTSISDLSKVYALSAEKLKKIEPYLQFGQ